LGGADDEAEDVLVRADRLLEEKWVLEDPANVIFEEEKDEVAFHKKRSKVLSCFAGAFSQLRKDHEKLQEAGAALLEDLERVQEEKSHALGEVAYWQTLSEDLAKVCDDRDRTSRGAGDVQAEATESSTHSSPGAASVADTE
jgi:hypothetical protein